MRLLDKQYTDTPYDGVRRMTAWLRSQGYARESQTRGAVDADDGARGDLSQTPLESDPSYASGVPVLTPWGPDYYG